MATPNMGLTLPTDHGSADVWDVILDAALTTIDSHDHSTGKGVKVPAGGLNINADVSWSSGGTSHGITDLVAVDFKPSPAANLVGLAAALFVSDGTSGLSANELYWRTTTGSNVKLTAGTALNVAAFTGGIGGDYAATGALVVFDDSTDSYWFQQQVGNSVRQYARMRSADVDLYEFKANPTAGVPTNRVRLASPTALAASYTLTMPAALPSSTSRLSVDTSGTVTAGDKHGTLTLPISVGGFVGPGVYGGAPLSMGINSGSLALADIPLATGERITAIRVTLVDNASGPTLLNFVFQSFNASTGLYTTISTSANSSGSGLKQTLQITGLTTTITTGNAYSIRVNNTGGSSATGVWMAEVDFDRP